MADWRVSATLQVTNLGMAEPLVQSYPRTNAGSDSTSSLTVVVAHQSCHPFSVYRIYMKQGRLESNAAAAEFGNVRQDYFLAETISRISCKPARSLCKSGVGCFGNGNGG